MRQSRLVAASVVAPLRISGARLHQKRVVIPPLTSSTSSTSSSRAHGHHQTEYDAVRYPHPDTAMFLDEDGAASLQRQQQVDAFRDSTDALIEKVWRDSKPHLRRQEELVKNFGVDGAVAETLRPTTTSFREELRQRPLDRAILEEIYHGLHGRRIERKLKKGVSWECWITKGDGTAPVYNTSQKAQQTFAFGGHIEERRCATHPQQFPTVRRPGAVGGRSSTAVPTNRRRGPAHGGAKTSASAFLDRTDLVPEVAFIGRTSSGKSSLVNAILNATVSPYGHLQGTTSSVRFYSVANKLMLVDCPGYGHYNPLQTPALDAENAVKCMRAYLRCGAIRTTPRRASTHSGSPRNSETGTAEKVHEEGSVRTENSAEAPGAVDSGLNGVAASHGDGLVYQPRPLKRVFLCVPAHGMQHLDYAYCQLLEDYNIPFAVVLTKTDAAPIRFLARLADHTRCQLVKYTHCKELMLTSSLRLAGIDKMQTLLGSMALGQDKYNGATMDFSRIV